MRVTLKPLSGVTGAAVPEKIYFLTLFASEAGKKSEKSVTCKGRSPKGNTYGRQAPETPSFCGVVCQ